MLSQNIGYFGTGLKLRDLIKINEYIITKKKTGFFLETRKHSKHSDMNLIAEKYKEQSSFGGSVVNFPDSSRTIYKTSTRIYDHK